MTAKCCTFGLSYAIGTYEYALRRKNMQSAHRFGRRRFLGGASIAPWRFGGLSMATAGAKLTRGGTMTSTPTKTLPPVDAIAVLDEAGLTAKVRNLTAAHDGQLGLVAALMLPTPDLAHWEGVFRAPFDAFVAAAPQGAKHHITDAFGSGDTDWMAAAHQSRSDIFDLVRQHRLCVTYVAREASVARASFEALQVVSARGKANKSPDLSVSERPSATRLVSECYEGLVSTIHVMAEGFGRQHVALYSDEIDDAVLAIMERDADRLRNVSEREVNVRGYDKAKKTPLHAKIKFTADVPGIDVTRVGTITKLGKSSSLVFATDVIVNSLYHHLQRLPVGTSFNIKKTVEGWALADQVFAPEDEAHDIYSKI